jgi:hypothetical protein
VDHPPRGSKDLADAMCGVTFGLTTSKMTWINHDVPLVQVPDHVTLQSKARGAKAPEDADRKDTSFDITDTDVFDFRGDPNARKKDR